MLAAIISTASDASFHLKAAEICRGESLRYNPACVGLLKGSCPGPALGTAAVIGVRCIFMLAADGKGQQLRTLE